MAAASDATGEVLVAGAGPVGLATAYELTRRDVRVRLVDAAPGPATTSRAIAIHPRTLETFHQMGLLDRIRERGQLIAGFTIFQEGRRLVRLAADYSTMPTRYPFTLAVEQVDTEAVLRDALAELGVRPEWGVAARTLHDDGDVVHVGLRTTDGGERTRRFRWLVGCDGGHSQIRKLLGLALVGESHQTWLLADAPLEVDLPRDSIYFVRTGGGTLMAVPLRTGQRWRLLDTVDIDDSGGPQAVAARFAAKLSRGLGRPVRAGDPTWTSVFTAQQRMVLTMRVGRCLLAGDAAHVHSPASGQGLNTGLQEAYNLSWKLAMVVDGLARPELLDTYSAERVPVGQALLRSTERATDLVDLHTPLADLVLPMVMTGVRTLPPLRRRVQAKILSGISGLPLHYAASPLTTPASGRRSAPVPGERLVQFGPEVSGPGFDALTDELRDPRWLLLLAGAPVQLHGVGVLATRQAAWMSTRTLVRDGSPAVPGPLPDPGGRLARVLCLTAGGWLLIRPDGYLAARGGVGDTAAVASAVARIPLTAPPLPSARTAGAPAPGVGNRGGARWTWG